MRVDVVERVEADVAALVASTPRLGLDAGVRRQPPVDEQVIQLDVLVGVVTKTVGAVAKLRGGDRQGARQHGGDQVVAEQAVAAANKLAGEGVALVAGHFCSGSSIPASQVYEEENIVQISPASTNPKLTDEGGPNVFRVCGRDDQQGLVAGDLLSTRFGGGKIAILHDKTAYGKGLADETKAALNAKGVQEAMYEAYTAGEKDYSALISKMKAAGVDTFYVGGYHTEAALMIRQAHEQGYKPQLVSGDALVTDEFWKISGPAGEGTLM
ncbi:MAG TPA: branched chain amino acid ABC transporter substrate-binding protein, partial [Gammaproteobacteria bacterium]|nr:branched chain amino acid ABC transporter substrate-binding protein [Gammaproteobacteria bacterium]